MKNVLRFPLVPLIVLWSIVLPQAAAADEPRPLKKIMVVSSNNEALPYEWQRMPSYSVTSAEKKKLRELRNYVSQRLNLDGQSDPEIFFTVLEWVSLQWKHDGLAMPPANASALDILKLVHEKKKRFRCVEYGTVQSEVLKAYGYASRSLDLRSADAAYGPPGSAHVLSEVWSNTLGKWIFIDPQFAISARHQGRYLSFYDMYELKKNGRFNEIEFMVPERYLKDNGLDRTAHIDQFKEFISSYFGYMTISVEEKGQSSTVALKLEGEVDYLTLQGFPSSRTLFTRNPGLLYFPVNRTELLFSFKDNSSDEKLRKLIAAGKINRPEDLAPHMAELAPEPHFSVALKHNAMDFAYFEYQLDAAKEWVRLSKSELSWHLKPGKNEIRVRTVNQFGVPGAVTHMRIHYGSEPVPPSP